MKSMIKVLDLVLPWRWWAAYRRYVMKITTSGYVPPLPSPRFHKFAQSVVRFWAWLQLGKVEVVNPQYLDTQERVIWCGNHSSLLDFAAYYPVLKRPIMAIGAYEVMRNFWGLPGIAMSKMGVIPVDRSHGKTVIEPAVRVIVEGRQIGLMPEGKINPTGELLPFKLGAAWITNAAFEQLGGKEKVGIVPFHICYHKRHVGSAFNFLLMGLRWRRGVTVTICKPIWLNELDNRDPNHIMCLVRSAILAVDCATTNGAPCN